MTHPIKQNVNLVEILAGLTTAVVWIDKNENIGFINLAGAELLQLSAQRVIGMNWRYILPRLLDDIHACGTGRLTIHEYTIRLPDAQKIHVTCTISYYEMDGDDGWLIELYNTERHHRIAEEDERWHQYEAGNLLVRTLAHEIKNPLAGIYGSTQLLQKRFPDNDKADQFLEVILREVKRLQNLVDRMLGPRGDADKEPYNIHELIGYVIDVVRGEKPDNVFIKLDYDPSIPEISMDFEAMVQALLNLVKNAIQAMEKHGGVLTLKTRVESKFTLGTKTYPLVAVISVMDEGEGIAPDVFDSIFYPMVSSKKSGSGLGLSVSQNIVRKHGGLIVAQSEPGNTVFNIYLPFDHNRSETQRLLRKERG
ncbi:MULTISPECIES: nitrogen regulation protein NR(II) [Piscirickettsiaceae]|jgi:two-component system nitrogen regulation sensor histidine kinase GlnL|uniref:histidine kinase n=1 Tax=Hydrogenovibrio thermophilus TaxID=265883 RepID=A0A410H2E2_9GAMM|nr:MULTISPECIES: nitrogen regulation protein NR(II) [Piscirickettsiaceae]AZR82372.1 histidine kinase [Thiomicrospira sp. S5]QAB15087.1 two-component sensor histidine kinase [Hydrogenovibrio thermophilus]